MAWLRAATVMAYIETLDSNLKVSTLMAYIEVLDSNIKVAAMMAYIEVLVPLEDVYTTKVGAYVELTGDETVYASKVGAYVEINTPWSSVPDDPTNLVAVVV